MKILERTLKNKTFAINTINAIILSVSIVSGLLYIKKPIYFVLMVVGYYLLMHSVLYLFLNIWVKVLNINTKIEFGFGKFFILIFLSSLFLLPVLLASLR